VAVLAGLVCVTASLQVRAIVLFAGCAWTMIAFVLWASARCPRCGGLFLGGTRTLRDRWCGVCGVRLGAPKAECEDYAHVDYVDE
jgi:hypothetical protein